MQSSKTIKESSLYHASMGSILIAVGILIHWPIQFNWAAVNETLSSLSVTWWRIVLIVMAASALAYLLNRKGYRIFSEITGAFACFAILYPFLGLLAGLPHDMGFTSLFFWYGSMVISISFSTFVSIAALKYVSQKSPTITT